jgi:hypothetical protein
MFPGVLAEVENLVTQRALLLASRLRAQREQHPGVRQKLATLAAIDGRGEAASAFKPYDL